jgi:predicted restriction endonuclease
MFEYQKKGKLVHECAKLTLKHIKDWRERYGSEIFFTQAAREIAREKLKRTEGLCGEILEGLCGEILEEMERFREIYGEAGI